MRITDVKLRFVGFIRFVVFIWFVGFIRFVCFIRFVGFNFGQVQLLRFVVVMVWSNSFGHLESVK